MKSLAAILGFLAGIALLSSVPLSYYGAAFLVLVSGTILLLYVRRREMAYLAAFLFFFSAACGAVRTELAHGALPERFADELGSHVSLEGKVVAEPDIRESSQRLTLLVKKEGETTKLLVVAPLYPRIGYGETVEASGMLSLPEPFDTDAGRVFRYDLFLAKDGVYALLERASVKVIRPRSGVADHVQGFFADLKWSGIDAVSNALPEPQAALASGLILGGKQGLGKELLDDFIVTGLVHVVVLSGYNVMIVAEAVFRAFALFAKRYAAVAAAVVIAAFVLIAGAGAASLRAGLMAGIALFGRATGRTYDAFRALMAAAILMLLWNPLLLMYDPGFELSFIATLGLIFGAPITERWFARIRVRFFREILAATVAAQISVLPLLLYQNGLFSLVALPANALVLPLVPLGMALSAFAGIAGFVAPAFAPVIALPAYAVLSLIIALTEAFAALPFGSVSVPAFPFWLVVASYALLALYVRKRLKTM